MEQAVGIGFGNEIVHEGEACVASYQDLLFLCTQQLCKELLGAGQTGQLSVISCVDAINDAVVNVQNLEHGGRQAELVCTGLASCHIQLETKGFVVIVTLLQGGICLLSFGKGQLGIGFHHGSSF